MSAGAFENGRYKTRNGDVFACRVQPETRQLTLGNTFNVYPTDPVDQPFPIKIRVGKRTRGLIPRTVTVRFTSTPPTGYLPGGLHTIPVFDPDVWDGYTDVANRTGTYLGAAVEMVGQFPPKD